MSVIEWVLMALGYVYLIIIIARIAGFNRLYDDD